MHGKVGYSFMNTYYDIYHILSNVCQEMSKGATIRILGGAGFFFMINIFAGKMGEINKWPQGMVEIKPILR